MSRTKIVAAAMAGTLAVTTATPMGQVLCSGVAVCAFGSV